MPEYHLDLHKYIRNFLIYYLQIALLRRAVEKFKSQLANETGSVCSTASPKNSSAYHRITPMSPSYSIENNRVTTSAIVSHETVAPAGLERKISRGSARNSRTSHTTSREVKWKDNEKSLSPASSMNHEQQQHDVWKEVNYNLTRLDRKIVHLETLLSRFTESIHQAAVNNNTEQSINNPNNPVQNPVNPNPVHDDQSSAI